MCHRYPTQTIARDLSDSRIGKLNAAEVPRKRFADIGAAFQPKLPAFICPGPV